MVEEKSTDQFGQNGSVLKASLNGKLEYLNDLQNSIESGNDLHVYQLINNQRYLDQFSGDDIASSSTEAYDFSLAEDLTAELSHHLSYKLIDFLGKEYPFFYYHEYELGQFDIYFGNWWDHRLFGKLDVINVAFEFNEEEYDKLAQSFRLEANNQQVNAPQMHHLADDTERLNQLVAEQDQRDAQKRQLQDQLRDYDNKSAMPWESARVKEEKQELENQLQSLLNLDQQAADASKQIKKNETEILKLSKEETILGFERQSIKQIFGSFEDFTKSNDQLYQKYLRSLGDNTDEKDQVNAND